MTPYEEGYKAMADRKGRDENPFDARVAPTSRQRWDQGWMKSRLDIRDSYKK